MVYFKALRLFNLTKSKSNAVNLEAIDN
jgi:hypothetical protein